MNLLITGAWSDAKEHIPEIEAMGHAVVFLQQEKDALPCDPGWVEGVICNGLFLHHPIDQFPNLRFIQLTSAGFDRVDMDYVQAHNIEIHNARGVYSIPMAEFAICGVLQLYKQSRFFYENQKAHKWEKHRGLLELYGKTVTILGCGSVGTECAKRFESFGCFVLGVDLYPTDNKWFESVFPLNRLDEILARTDILILALPLTDRTRGLINADRLQQIKPGAILVNISRGGVVDENAILAALRQKRLAGAVLDVFEREPLEVDNPVWNTENIILSPHNSFTGEGNQHRLSGVIMQHIPDSSQ